MKIERLVVGQLATNCYLVSDKKNEAIIIDPGDDGDYIIQRILDLKLSPKLIIATHGHFDHVLAAFELRLAFNIPFLIHKADLFLLKQARQSARHFLKIEIDPVALPDKFVKDGDLLKFSGEQLGVISTPGHTPGSISLYYFRHAEEISVSANNYQIPKQVWDETKTNVVFTGDTLFAEGVGRTDFSYSSKKDLEKSIKKLSRLPGETIAYPGHGEETTIGEARKFL